MIKRDIYLQQLINAKHNGFCKVITGIRRVGKSYLLKNIFYKHLIESGTNADNIIIIELDDISNANLREPFALWNFLLDKLKNKEEQYYIFIDEIQLVNTIINPVFTNNQKILAKETDENSISFVDVVLAISKLKNVDLYVTGSNSKLLSKNILTQFRDKATNIHLYPLSFKEYYDYLNGDKYERFYNYMIYGGMPLSVLKNNNFEKEKYLKELFKTTYINDVIEYNKFKKNEFLDELCDIISFSTGQLLNTQKISNIFKSRKKENIGKETIDKYIKSFEEAYIISEAKRYDIKGNSTIGSTRKYYFLDTGLRNARLNFTSLDIGQILENVIYKELLIHNYNVKVGTFNQVEKNNNKSILKTYEVDFYATKGTDTLYLQVTDNIDEENLKLREITPFKFIRDSNIKIILVNRPIQKMKLENGIIVWGIIDFLLNLN